MSIILNARIVTLTHHYYYYCTSQSPSEVKALYQLTVDILFLINLSDEIQRPISLPTIVLEDNNPSVQLSESLSSRIKRSKHFLMIINFIRHQVSLGLVKIRGSQARLISG